MTRPSLPTLRGASVEPPPAQQQPQTPSRDAVDELVDALVERATSLQADQLVSVTFSVTADLDACFPAAIARRQPGWDQVALLDCQQMAVQGDLARCIRLLAHVWLPAEQNPCHAYLGEASFA